MKYCPKCDLEKELTEFHKRGSRYRSWCKECRRSHESKKSRKGNVKSKEYNKHYYKENQEEQKLRAKVYRDNNKDQVRKYGREYSKSRKENDLNFKIGTILRSRLGELLSGKSKNGSAIKDLGCSVEFLIQYLESMFSDNMSWDNYGKGHSKWQIDHIEPLCSFDLTDRKQLLRACNYTNLQPLWYREHREKTAEDIKKSIRYAA